MPMVIWGTPVWVIRMPLISSKTYSQDMNASFAMGICFGASRLQAPIDLDDAPRPFGRFLLGGLEMLLAALPVASWTPGQDSDDRARPRTGELAAQIPLPVRHPRRPTG